MKIDIRLYRHDLLVRHTSLLIGLLTDTDLAETERLFRPEDRQRRRLDRAVTRLVLARYLGRPPLDIVFRKGRWGKPTVAGGGVDFNVSRTDNCFAIVTAKSPVGLDIETPSETWDADGLANSLLHKDDAAAFHAGPAHDARDRFLRIWTETEAFIKATGHGFSVDTRGYRFVPTGPETSHVLRRCDDQSTGWYVTHFGLFAGHRLAVASQSPHIDAQVRYPPLAPCHVVKSTKQAAADAEWSVQ